MRASEKPPIRVVTAADTVWSEAFHRPEEAEAPGRDFTAAVSPDEKFSAGWWERDEQRRPFVRAFHEVAIILEGEVEITLDDGTVLHAVPGDIIDTPKGSGCYWNNLSPVRKFWAIYDHD